MLLCLNMTFNQCFREHYRMLCYFAFQYVQETGKAEDVTQEVFMRILEERMTFNSEDHLKRWLFVAVKNACLNHIKSVGIRSRILDRLAGEGGNEDTDFFNAMVRTEVYRQIQDAIDELPRECGRVFRMAYIEGLANEEIAGQMGISIHTVKSQKQKAKSLLRDRLKDLYPIALLAIGLARELLNRP